MVSSRVSWGIGFVGVLAVALHCGPSESAFTEGEACKSVYRGLCGKACSNDGECADGLYCADEGKCNADCAPDIACPDGLVCSSRGRCGGVGGPGFQDGGGQKEDAEVDACADVNLQLTKLTPKVLFLLDQSSSMWLNQFQNTSNSRWDVLKNVLIGPAATPGGVLKQLEGEAEIAVEMYSATDDDPSGDNSFLPVVTYDGCPRFNGAKFDGLSFESRAYEGVNAILRDAGVDDDTPTGPAIREVVGIDDDGGLASDAGFAALPTKAPKVLVLVTDGEPTQCNQNSPSSAARAGVIRAVQQTYTHGIKTFVIAIGDLSSPTAAPHFNAVANAGLGLDPATGDAGAIQPSSPDQLVEALKKVVRDARTCTFELNGEVQAGMESAGTVKLNGVELPYLAPGASGEGWRLVSPSRIELVGAACETIKSTDDATIAARFPCGAVKETGLK